MGSNPLQHGGRIHAAALQYAIPLHQWLDLSTGINPNGRPIPLLPANLWQRLPEDDDGLFDAAQSYYGCSVLLPVAGSQAALQTLPQLRPACRVGILAPAYAEHAHAWQQAGHTVERLASAQIEAHLDALDVLIIIHPNNPTGEVFEPQTLLQWHQRLGARGGWLIVDEAFIDPTPKASLAAHAHLSGLIILRSLGKFFGLAGARVGFVLAEQRILNALAARLGPWPIATPARHIARLALLDKAWQQSTRERLYNKQARLANLLAQHKLTPHGGCALFQWTRTPNAAAWHAALAQRGILTRLFDAPASLRFGLPPDEDAWTRLAQALSEIRI